MRILVTTLAFFFVVGTAPLAMAQSTNTLVAEGLALPKDHQYEQYNAAAGSYGKVDVSKVPALVKQKQPIYDRTAKAWVYQSAQGLNPKYAAGTAAAPASAPAASAPAATPSAATAPAPAATGSTPAAPAGTAPAVSTPVGAPASTALVTDGLTLPRDRQYERYDKAAGTYSKVDVNQVPALVKQKVPIYDRTAKAWVLNTAQKLDPRYAAAAPGAAAVSTPAAPALTLPAATPLAASGLTLPRDHQYERFNPGSSTYAKVDVKQVPALVEQKVPIYDRTAKVWVLNTEQKLDPRYGTAASAMPLSSLPAGQSLTLPKDHQYERYDLASATYSKIDVSQVPTLVQKNVPIYDRTAKTWVLDTEQQVDSRYVAGAARPK